MIGSSRREFLKSSTVVASASVATAKESSDRDYWVGVLTRIAEPVLNSLSQRKLKASMPVEAPHGNAVDRRQYTYLEALGRLLAGMGPWLESGSDSGHEGELRHRYCELARQSIAAGVDPSSPDFMNFSKGAQPVVDAAFLALGILRAPSELWDKLERNTKVQLIDALKSSRVIRPGFSNWLLFSATIEAFFCHAGEAWDKMRVDYAIRQHEEWYKGDGVYGDGPQFHWDYYNSFVIQPMLLAVLDARVERIEGVGFVPCSYAGARKTICRDRGAFDQSGRNVSGYRALACVPLWRISVAGRYCASPGTAGGRCTGAGSGGINGRHPKND